MKYWVVGAMFGGSDDAFDSFMKRGYWYCWDPRANSNDEPSIVRQQEKVRQIEPGDKTTWTPTPKDDTSPSLPPDLE